MDFTQNITSSFDPIKRSYHFLHMVKCVLKVFFLFRLKYSRPFVYDEILKKSSKFITEVQTLFPNTNSEINIFYSVNPKQNARPNISP
jgi:hypothetical protein